jgi:RimJ/RimL family protein N-acetyltransferase
LGIFVSIHRRNMDSLCVRGASLVDQAAALELVFAHAAPEERRQRLARLLAESPSSPLPGLFVGYRGGELVAAALVQVQPGGTAVLSPPRACGHQPAETARELLSAVVAELARDGVQWVQSLLETDQGPDARLLIESGFRHVSNLLYLVSTKGSFPASEPRDGLEFFAYTPQEHQRLSDIVERTYADSLDFPQVDGTRRIEDILTGYRATGVFDPARWMIVRRQGVDVGCLLLAEHPSTNHWELIYMGLVPEGRGRGFGVAIARYAQWLTRQADRARLVLGVDAANAPAIAVYAAAGFVAWDHRSVFMRVS